MLLKMYLVGTLLSLLLTVIYYWLVVTKSLVIDIIAGLFVTALSWAGVLLFVLRIRTIIYRAKEKRLEKLRREQSFIDLVRISENDPFTNSDTELITTRVRTALRITKDQFN